MKKKKMMLLAYVRAYNFGNLFWVITACGLLNTAVVYATGMPEARITNYSPLGNNE